MDAAHWRQQSGGRREQRQSGYTAAAGNITHQPELGLKGRRDNRLCFSWETAFMREWRIVRLE